MNVYIGHAEHVKKIHHKTFILAPQWTSFQRLQRHNKTSNGRNFAQWVMSHLKILEWHWMRYNISNKCKQISLEVWFGAILHTEIEKQFHTEIAGEFHF